MCCNFDCNTVTKCLTFPTGRTLNLAKPAAFGLRSTPPPCACGRSVELDSEPTGSGNRQLSHEMTVHDHTFLAAVLT